MVNFCLNNEEVDMLKGLVGKTIIKIRHDPLNKFDGNMVYGRVKLFFSSSILLINYDYEPYGLFGSQDDDHPRLSIKTVTEEEAVSALRETTQIDIPLQEKIVGITLVNEYSDIEWDNKKDSLMITTAIIFKLNDFEMVIQGDYMMPLLEIVKTSSVKEYLAEPGEEFSNDPTTKYKTKRVFVDL